MAAINSGDDVDVVAIGVVEFLATLPRELHDLRSRRRERRRHDGIDFDDGDDAGAFPEFLGEIVQFYFTGLGPVTPQVADGKPSPASPLSQLTTPLKTSFLLLGGAPQVLFAGLAPGLTGVYQVSIQLPAKIVGLPANENAAGLMQIFLIEGDFDIPIWVQPNQ